MMVKLRFLKFIIISNLRHLKSTVFFYAITSILLFFIIILNDSLNEHISTMFPKEFFISAYIEGAPHTIDVSNKVFNTNYMTQFHQSTGYSIQIDTHAPEIIINLGSIKVRTPFSVSCCDDFLSISELFAQTYDLSEGCPLIIQGRYYTVTSIHNDLDDSSPIILPQDSSVYVDDPTISYKVVHNDLDPLTLEQLLKQIVKSDTIQFDILVFDIEEALNAIVDILFGLLFAVGVLVFIVASFNIKSMTVLSISKRQREIVLYYLYGLAKKDLFTIFQTESFCVHLFSLLVSYCASVCLIFITSRVLSFSFQPALIKALIVCLVQILLVQRITRTVLLTCITESISKI